MKNCILCDRSFTWKDWGDNLKFEQTSICPDCYEELKEDKTVVDCPDCEGKGYVHETGEYCDFCGGIGKVNRARDI